MAKRNAQKGTYWLAVVEHIPGHTCLVAESGYKPCCRPGYYRVMTSLEGLVCPGCDRTCRIPATAGLERGDAIAVVKAIELGCGIRLLEAK